MSFFSPAHLDDLANTFWQQGEARCPHDGKLLDSRFHPQHTGYLLVMACNHCGKKAQFTRFSDPKRYTFRPWTSAEVAAMSSLYGAGQNPQCPVCWSRTSCREICPGSDVTLECMRCGNVHLLTLQNTTDLKEWAMSA